MKQKTTVITRHFLNGVFQRETSENRTVYTRKDGSMYINWMGGTADVYRDENQRIVKDWKCAEIKAMSGQDFMDSLLKKAAGRPLNIVALPPDFGKKK